MARITMHTGVLPTIPIAGMWEADLIRALGAWQALPRDEDSSLKIAATTAASGVSTPLSTYVYRRDVDGQRTRSEAYTDAGRWCRQAAVDRLRALCRGDIELNEIATGDWSAFLRG